MRKGLSILSVLVIILSLVHVTVATHYCGGEVAATKVSLSGQLASCGMEMNDAACPVHENNISHKCCEDNISTAGVFSKYTVSGSPGLPVYNSTASLVFASGLFPYISPENLFKSFNDTGPPGVPLYTRPALQMLCILRI